MAFKNEITLILHHRGGKSNESLEGIQMQS